MSSSVLPWFSAFGRGLIRAADDSAGRTLLGYEVGTFTPAMAFITPGTSSWAYGAQGGIYIKFGRAVWISVNLDATPTLGTASGGVRFTGFPFAADAVAVLPVGGTNANLTSWVGARTQLYALVESGQSRAALQSTGANLSTSGIAPAQFTGGASHTFQFSGIYRTAS